MLDQDAKRLKREREIRQKMGTIHILVADADYRILNIVRKVLKSFGFEHIHSAKDGSTAITMLRELSIDLLITEWPMEPMTGIDLVQFIRTSSDSPQRDLPIIMLTGNADQKHVLYARDIGVTEFLVKPFTAKTLSHRIIQVIDNPRSFINAPNYVGPDRRRREPLPPGGQERRISQEALDATAIDMGDHTVYQVRGEVVMVHAPNRDIRQKLGKEFDASEILNTQIVEKAQRELMQAQGEFIDWILVDLQRMERAYDKLRETPTDSNYLKEIKDIAFAVMSQAGTFNFSLGTEVGKSLHDFVEDVQSVTPNVLTVIRKHIDTIYVIFHKRLEGKDTGMREEVIGSLGALISKIGNVA